jgi:formate hydrogenlyase subunit 3/multisubunit Na+/H+ antiporter MnhD subunit
MAAVIDQKPKTSPAHAAPPPGGLGVTLLAVAVVLFGCVLGLVPAVRVLSGAGSESLRWNWDAAHGPFVIELDALGAFFLIPVLGLSALAGVYGGNYLLAYRGRKSLGVAWFFFALFVASMALVVLARTAYLFLAAWEVMSLSAYFLVTFEHEKPEVRRAGWVYLIATHVGVAFLIAAFALLGRLAGSLDFEAFRAMPAPAPAAAGVIFVLALVGFGAKAGLVPFHVWLPEAHPAAPSHVSALMSGVMIKMGIYGLLRVLSFLGAPAAWWGLTLASLGLLTGLVGIALALHQRDVKRALAYSSIENMGLIALALGIALWGTAQQLPLIAALGAAAALLHIWNHALMKGLMFLAAGSVLHGTGTRDMEQLGGLMRRMPWTGGLMVFGAVAIAALPPLNGFASKWLMYLGLLKVGVAAPQGPALAALLSVSLLALIGGLAAVALVRLCGIALLGAPRSKAAEHAHEASPWMLGPMLVLALLCLASAVLPGVVVGLLAAPLEQVLGPASESAWNARVLSEAPLTTLGAFSAGTIGLLALVAAGWATWSRQSVSSEGPTWGCGYLRPTPRIQYTGRSFAEMMAEHLLPRFLRPGTTRKAPEGLFPGASQFTADEADPVCEKVYEPFFARWARRFAHLRILQQGKAHVYLFYILVMVVLALAWVSIRSWWGTAS